MYVKITENFDHLAESEILRFGDAKRLVRYIPEC